MIVLYSAKPSIAYYRIDGKTQYRIKEKGTFQFPIFSQHFKTNSVSAKYTVFWSDIVTFS